MNKRTSVWFSLITIGTVLLASYFLYFNIEHPYVGALVKKSSDQYIIEQTEPNSWSSEYLTQGEIVHSINKKPPEDYEMVKKFNLMEQAESVTVIDPITKETAKYDIEQTVNTSVIFQVILPTLVLLFSIFSSYFILSNQTQTTKSSSILLVLFLFDISIAYIMGGSSARGNDLARSIIPIFFMLVPILYLHFIYHYFRELGSTWFSKHWIYLSYVTMVISSIMNLLLQLRDIPISLSPSFVTTFYLIAFMSLFILVIVMVVIGLRKLKSKTHRYLLRGIVFVNIVAFIPFVTLYALPYVIFDVHIFSPVILSSFIMLIPIALGYQFMMRKMYDIDFILGRFKYYVILSILPAILGIVLLLLLDKNRVEIFTIQGFIIMSLVVYLSFYFKEFMDYKFKFIRISEKHNYQKNTFEFMEKIREANDLSEVIEEIKSNLLHMLHVTDVALFEYCSDENEPLCKDIPEHLVEDMNTVSQKVGTIVEHQNGFLLSIGDSKYTHFIIKASGDGDLPRLTRDEITWLKSLAYYTHITLENFIKIENVMTQIENIDNEMDKDQNNSGLINRVLFQLEEKQRSILARDLHDSVLQDLLSIKKKIELDSYFVDESLETAKVELLKDMTAVIKTTRNTCHELRPNVLFDLGLERATKKLIDMFSEEHGIQIRLTSNRLNEEIPHDIQLNLYRVIQELLNNTAKHAKATNVVVILVKIGDILTLHYEDNGVGTEPSKLYTNTGSIGLSGMRERIRMINGHLEITTAEGEGFKALVEIDLKEKALGN